jgi:hypothetical protein
MRTVMIGFWIAVLFPLNTQAQTIPELGFPTPTQTLPSNISFSSFNKEYASDAVFSPKGELFIANSSQIIKYQQQKPQVLGSLKDANIQAFAISAKGLSLRTRSSTQPETMSPNGTARIGYRWAVFQSRTITALKLPFPVGVYCNAKTVNGITSSILKVSAPQVLAREQKFFLMMVKPGVPYPRHQQIQILPNRGEPPHLTKMIIYLSQAKPKPR